MGWLPVLAPLALAFALVFLGRRAPRALGPLVLAAIVATLAAGAWAAIAESSGALGWGPRLGLTLSATGFARVMTVLVPAVALPVIAHAVATEHGGRARLLSLMLAFVGVMELLVLAADLLTLLIAWELVGAMSWALIGHGWKDPANPTAATQAFVTTRVGDLGLYLAAGAALATGSLSYSALAGADGWRLDVIAAGVLLAASAKSAQLPFSPWLFSAMAGPTPVSALLHSSTMVAAGAYVLIRLAPYIEPTGWFRPAALAIGLTTAVAGGLVALVQTHPKRVLAGSTSAQYGLMFAAVGAGSTASAGAQLVAHAAFKSLLFLAAGIALHVAGTEDLGQMGLRRKLPVVAVAAGVGALALAAVPPLGAAWSKEEIVAAVVASGPWLAVVTAFAAAFLSAAYAARFWTLAYGRSRASAGDPAGSDGTGYLPGRLELAALLALAITSLALGALWLSGAAGLVERLTGGLLPAGPGVAASRGRNFVLSILAIAAAFTMVAWLRRTGRLASRSAPAAIRAAGLAWLGIPAAARVLVVDPVLGFSRVLAHFDDRVVDAGVRGAAWIASAGSRLLSHRGELSFDGIVRALAGGTLFAAGASRVADERGIDRAVEDLAAGVGVAGRESRRVQTGLTHHYYIIVAGGIVAILAALLVRA